MIKGAFTLAQTCSNLESDLCMNGINENKNKITTLCTNAAVINGPHEIIMGESGRVFEAIQQQKYLQQVNQTNKEMT